MPKDSDNSQRDDIVIGRNAVLELLRSAAPVEAVFIQKGLSGTVTKIAAIARDSGVPVKDAAAVKLDNMCAHGNHQGVIALTAGADYNEMDDIFKRAGDAPLFVVIADEIEDPHNLGALIRTAEAAGAHGLIIPKRRSAGLTFTVAKASAGAVAHLPVVRVANIAETIETLKKRGVWFYAADMEGQLWCETDFGGPCGLVIGSEGKGIGRLVKERCDFAVSLPMFGQINSLNASVAGGIIMYEIARQRMKTPNSR
ncbi:MAG: 23S rRNA (guanosine(2251)-2'-O)-methyltransferase RlmB [Oscillospiraceae bacterium]|jgi:23S rRNA (guanosine2251-2'-O)-methyltransferase|nr:23S rRNA (guanosine(2251)-2'-O)-methyltransferase RlmB [Oscillospiraceae bacterium]